MPHEPFHWPQQQAYRLRFRWTDIHSIKCQSPACEARTIDLDPIQEDETALVIYSLWKHYALTRDLEYVESVYNSLIKNAADFMVAYRDGKTGLPASSYDLWEEKYGISTFTTSTVVAALAAAGKFSAKV